MIADHDGPTACHQPPRDRLRPPSLERADRLGTEDQTLAWPRHRHLGQAHGDETPETIDIGKAVAGADIADQVTTLKRFAKVPANVEQVTEPDRNNGNPLILD